MTARIMVVDDDEFILKLLTVALSRAGHKVFTASDGSRALSQVNGIQPDLIITRLNRTGQAIKVDNVLQYGLFAVT